MAAEKSAIEIDGSVLEGVSIFVEYIAFLERFKEGAYCYVHNTFRSQPQGGQILRNAITFGCLLNRSIRVCKIRAGRQNSGLRPQHTTGNSNLFA